jgi:hypothetical protein
MLRQRMNRGIIARQKQSFAVRKTRCEQICGFREHLYNALLRGLFSQLVVF